MVGFLVILFFVICAIIVIVSHSKCLDSELDDYVSNTLSKGIKPSKSICIQVGTSKIMLREDFIQKEWNKEKDGIPVRGEYESAEHFMKRMNAYRKRNGNKALTAAHKQKMKELTKKQPPIVDRWKRDIPKSEYEADEILKNYNGTN